MDCSLPDSSVHRIFQSRILEWVAISYSILLFGIYVNNKMNPSKLTTISRTKILPIIKHFKHFPICCLPLLKSNKYFNFVLKIKHFYLYVFSLPLNFTELNILYADFWNCFYFFHPTLLYFILVVEFSCKFISMAISHSIMGLF